MQMLLTSVLHTRKYISKTFMQPTWLEHSLGADDWLACKPRNQLSQLAAASEHLQHVLGQAVRCKEWQDDFEDDDSCPTEHFLCTRPWAQCYEYSSDHHSQNEFHYVSVLWEKNHSVVSAIMGVVESCVSSIQWSLAPWGYFILN